MRRRRGFGHCTHPRTTGLLPLSVDAQTDPDYLGAVFLVAPTFFPVSGFENQSPSSGIINAGRTITSSALKLLQVQLFLVKTSSPLHRARRLITGRA